MARTFGKYSPKVPLGTTWEESITLADADLVPIDLTGFHARAQLRTGLNATGAPVLELSSEGANPTITITGPSGLLTFRIPHTAVSALSTANIKRILLWDVELFTRDVGDEVDYVIPCITGKVTFLPRVTRANLT